jgi:hypothetical protein
MLFYCSKTLEVGRYAQNKNYKDFRVEQLDIRVLTDTPVGGTSHRGDTHAKATNFETMS